MKLDRVRHNYDQAARNYDRWNHIIFDRLLGVERFRLKTVERLGDLQGKRVLDIGCGTGLNLPYLAERVGPEGEIVGVDYSEGMLEQARARVEENGWRNVRLVQGDAAQLDGIEGPFDAALSTWVLGIVHDLPSALERAVTLLEPGGRFAVLDFDKTIPDQGIRRLLSPLFHWLLRIGGIDDREDLDDARLRRRWAEGKQLLRERLDDVQEEPYFQTGFLLSGRRPAETGS